jgi:hypothetical protein
MVKGRKEIGVGMGQALQHISRFLSAAKFYHTIINQTFLHLFNGHLGWHFIRVT